MPTTYAHDLFGKLTARKMPDEIRQILKRNKNIYRIGLHGPDVLFYFMFSKNPVSTYGVTMHNTNAREFFETNIRIARERQDEKLLAYLLGFACHFLLDSTCHPYVIQMANDHKITHTKLETEMDRVFMLENGLDPHQYFPSACIVPKYEYAQTIHLAIPKIPAVCIWLSMHMMKILTNLMVNNDESRKRKLAYYFTGLFGKKAQNFVVDYIMTLKPSQRDRKYVDEGIRLFHEALDEAPEKLLDLYANYHKDSRLCERWERTYNT